MVKQRNIFNPEKIDILKDETERQAQKRIEQDEQRERQRQILEAYNKGPQDHYQTSNGHQNRSPAIWAIQRETSRLILNHK